MEIYDEYKPVVSIIMPTYNRASYLKRSIDSVLKQTFKQWELIIIDDGSTDDSLEIIKVYLDKYKQISYFKHSNRGPALSINVGLEKSSGDYVTILCSDDEYKDNHLAERIKYMEQHPNIDFIHGGVEIIGNEYVPDKDNPNKKIHLSKCAIGGTFFTKREIFISVDGFKPAGISGDANMLNKVSQKYSIAKVNFPTYIYYRDLPDSITNNI